MYISKPSWIGHWDERQRPVNIFTIDAHPDGTRIATGGLDTKVKVWRVAPILSDHATAKPTDALLCSVALHDGAVLCVRWSHQDGQYLASGSDDKIIVIWIKDDNEDGFTGGILSSGDEGRNIENWKAVRRLVGHESDVTDLAWSSDNTYLASCGLDSRVIVWNGNTFEIAHTLTSHQGFVKGVTWDPLSKFLATQSDDKTTIIWRTSDWQAESQIAEPYAQSSSTTFFRRPSWSPDGAQLATANATNSGLSSSAIVARGSWKSDVHLVGHDAPIEVVRFNPRLFQVAQTTDGAQAALDVCTVCAVGSQDGSLTFWTTSRSRPMLVASDMFQHSILDVAWAPDGMIVYACSFDGTVAVIQLDDAELGKPLSADEQNMYFSGLGLQRKQAVLAETPEQMVLEEENAVQQAKQSSERVARLMGDDSTTSMHAHNGNVARMPASTTIGSNAERAAADVAISQKVEISADGKRRVQPQFIRSLTGTPARAPSHHFATSTQPAEQSKRGKPTAHSTPSISATTQAMSPAYQPAAMVIDTTLEVAPPSRSLPPGGLETVVVAGSKRTNDAPDSKIDGSTGRQRTNNEVSATRTRATVLAPELAVSSIRLSVPKVRSVFSHGRLGDQSLVFECHNPLDGKPCSQIVCSRQGQVHWRQALSSAILLLVASSVFCAATCEDGTLHVFSETGRRLLPCMCLNAPVSFLDCNGPYLMCLTAVGQVSVWNITERRALLSGVSIAPVLYSEPATLSAPSTDPVQASVTITDAYLQTNATPVLCAANGCVFAYDAGMEIWTRVVDAWYATSEYYSSAADALAIGTAANQHPLTTAQAAAERTCTHRRRVTMSEMLQSDRDVRELLSLSHLESQLTSAELLGSPEEYQRWLLMYARRLARDEALERAEELCRDLFGPAHADTGSIMSSSITGWVPTVLGMCKHELLRAVLPMLGANRAIQRIVHEYSVALQEADGRST